MPSPLRPPLTKFFWFLSKSKSFSSYPTHTLAFSFSEILSLHARLFYRILYLPLTFARMEVISIKLANWSGGSAFSTATPFSLNSLLHPMSTPHLGQECLSHLVMSSFSDYIHIFISSDFLFHFTAFFLDSVWSAFAFNLQFWSCSFLSSCQWSPPGEKIKGY